MIDDEDYNDSSACTWFRLLIDSIPSIYYMSILGSVLMYKLCTLIENKEQTFKNEHCTLSYNDYVC